MKGVPESRWSPTFRTGGRFAREEAVEESHWLPLIIVCGQLPLSGNLPNKDGAFFRGRVTADAEVSTFVARNPGEATADVSTPVAAATFAQHDKPPFAVRVYHRPHVCYGGCAAPGITTGGISQSGLFPLPISIVFVLPGWNRMRKLPTKATEVPSGRVFVFAYIRGSKS